MKHPIKILSLSAIAALLSLLASCSDDLILPGDDRPALDEAQVEADGQPIDVWLEDDALRTRNVQFGQGTSVRINTVWLGIFDIQNGNLVSSQEVRMGYAFLTSGTAESGVIRHKLPAPNRNPSSGQGYFMVAVVNYNLVNGYKTSSSSELRPLTDLLGEVNTWSDFNAIGVDTQSAYYEGDEDDSGHSSDSPVMAGFLHYDPVVNGIKSHPNTEMHLKVDQFASTTGNQKVQLSPATAINPVASGGALRFTQATTSDKYNLTNYTLYLRRLVANINVNIVPDNDKVEITKVSYKVYNTPKSVYLIERRMLDNEDKFTSTASLSPNFADNMSIGYESDEHWNETPSQGSNGSWSFSFQHFANKHWARTQPEDYADREKVTYDSQGNISYFNALASNSSDFNNNASYIVLKMHITDKLRNRCAETEYIIHEGYTSNADGLAESNQTTRLNDFSVARNVNYTYTVNVHGIDNIYYNVNANPNDKKEDDGEEDEEKKVEDVFSNQVTQHRPDQQGQVWNVLYAGETKNNDGISNFGYIPPTDEYIHGNYKNFLDWNGQFGNKGIPVNDSEDKFIGTYYPAFIKFDSNNPDIAFRIYGYNSASNATNAEDRVEGYNFNFSDESFTYLNNLWPPSVGDKSRYFQDYDALVNDYLRQVGDDKQGSIDTQLFYTFQFRIHNPSGTPDPKFKLENKVEELKQPDNTTKTNTFSIDLNNWESITHLIQAIKYFNSHKEEFGGEVELPAFDLLVAPRALEGSYDTERPMDYVRALYIGDKNGKIDGFDGCSKRQNIFAAIQGIQK
ncbi:MAG: hypothetical protein J1D77_05655 [Muribaculaceae bacterium]|nr:hypothetical protein [Muribaculaceae bacterium]